jgi:hypothetical protein
MNFLGAATAQANPQQPLPSTGLGGIRGTPGPANSPGAGAGVGSILPQLGNGPGWQMNGQYGYSTANSAPTQAAWDARQTAPHLQPGTTPDGMFGNLNMQQPAQNMQPQRGLAGLHPNAIRDLQRLPPGLLQHLHDAGVIHPGLMDHISRGGMR